ncbi:MAG: glycosyltransferase family 2 protein [Oscillospiraceae bacterium]|nr:glycosyltransferase family 2 protein [Oscillospiraceae bacterium]
MKKISIMIPCYNESENIHALYRALRKQIGRLDRYQWDIVFADNGSTDNTVELLRSLSEKDGRIRVIVNQTNYGVERSSTNLILAASADAIITISADLEDPPSLIPKFIAAWEQGWKVVLGKYVTRKENPVMRAFRSLYYSIIAAFSDVKVERNVTGFGLFDISVIDEFRELGEYSLVTRFLCAELGYPIKYIPYNKPKRKGGKSSYSLLKYYRTAVDSLVLTSHAPLHLASFFGFLVSVCSIFVALYYFIQKLLHWNTFELGLAPLTIGLFFLGGVQLFFIGVLSEYISSMIKRQQHRPYVIEKERINFEGYGKPGRPERDEDDSE